MSETASHSSRGSRSSGASSASSFASGAGPDDQALGVLEHDGAKDENISDLLDQNRGVEEAVFACVHLMSKNRSIDSYRLLAAKVVVEFLQVFLVVFNVSCSSWKIDTSAWIYRASTWVMFRSWCWDKGYDVYIAALYVAAGSIIAICLLTVLLAVVLRRSDDNASPWLRRLIWVVRMCALLVFVVAPVSCLDLISYLFSCNWSAPLGQQHHLLWTDTSCTALPHLIHEMFAVVAAAVLVGATLCMAVAEHDVNPMTSNLAASPTAVAGLKVTALKLAMTIIGTCMSTVPAVQAVLMLLCVVMIIYYQLDAVPYYYTWLNHIWLGLWTGIVYTCALLVALAFSQLQDPIDKQLQQTILTNAVLWGIFPSVGIGMLLSHYRLQWGNTPLQKFVEFWGEDVELTGDPNQLKAIYRFNTPDQVEFLSRAMRRWDEDGVPIQDATEHGALIIQAGLAQYPGSAMLMTLQANYSMVVLKDGQAARTHLTSAAKSDPDVLQRYFLYVAQDTLKAMKTDVDGGLDLMGYVEYQRNFRACVAAHKAALQSQRAFWYCVLRDVVPFQDIQRRLRQMSKAEAKAQQVYRRVMERYPRNGKLLKIYGKFQEFVLHDPWRAARSYQEAVKAGLGDSILNLTGQGGNNPALGGEGVNGGEGGFISTVDEKVDGVCIINSVGKILVFNQAAYRLFGYSRGELEGKNVSVLMSNPFSSHHNTYLSNYMSSGKAKILNASQAVVGLHKDRSIFPVSLFVTRLSGMGKDSVFIGVFRQPLESDQTLVRVWTTTGGTILCADTKFSDWFGVVPQDLIGKNLAEFGKDEGAITRLIQDSFAAAVVGAGCRLRLRTQLRHKYLRALDVDIAVSLGGTGDQRILISNIKCLTDSLAMMVVDSRGKICYATTPLATMLGHTVRNLSKMSFQGLIPPPHAQLHKHWMKGMSVKPRPGSCRAGAVVHLLTATATKVPVRMEMSTLDEDEHGGNNNHQQNTTHVIKVSKSSHTEMVDQQRLSLTVDTKGTVLAIDSATPKSLFGFNPSDIISKPLGSFLHTFGQWKREGHGSDETLLSLLAVHAQLGNAESAWRVGVHPPVSDDKIGHVLDDQASSSGRQTLGAALCKQTQRVRPAVMTLQLLDQSNDDEDGSNDDVMADLTGLKVASATKMQDGSKQQQQQQDASSGVTDVRIRLHLFRADLLNGVIELDGHLAVAKADASAALLLGTSVTVLQKKGLPKFIDIPGHICKTSDLLQPPGGAKTKASALKATASSDSRIGPEMSMSGTHGDGQPVHVMMQAVSKDGRSCSRALARLQLLQPSTGSLAPFLALRGQSSKPAVAVLERTATAATAFTAFTGKDGSGSDGSGTEWAQSVKSLNVSRRQSEDWKVQSESGYPQQQPRATAGLGNDLFGAAAYHAGDWRLSAGTPMGTKNTAKFSQDNNYNDGGAADGAWVPPTEHLISNLKTMSEGANLEKGEDDASEAGSGSGKSSVMDDATSMTNNNGGEDLTSDWRRAKRLKRIERQLNSSAATAAASRFGRHGLVVLFVLLLAHVICYGVLDGTLKGRSMDAYGVLQLAYAVDKTQMITFRANIFQKCATPLFASMPLCSIEQENIHLQKLLANTVDLRYYHQGLLLGFDGGPRTEATALTNYMLYSKLNEEYYIDSSNFTAEQRNTSLFKFGNSYIDAGVQVAAAGSSHVSGAALATTRYWQYLYRNGRGNLFRAYAYALDLYVGYCWDHLGSLTTMLIILLAVECIVVQLVCLLYQTLLVRLVSASHMRMFLVFLVLPSATIRMMATAVCKVDDEDAVSEADDDDLAVADAGGGATSAGGNATAAGGVSVALEGMASVVSKAGKSVRLSADMSHHRGSLTGYGQMGNRSTFASARSAQALPLSASEAAAGANPAATAATATSGSRLHALSKVYKQLRHFLLGWIETRMKVNGKKLQPSMGVFLWFMGPLLAWGVTVVVIFGVSFDKVALLQGPLTSLQVSAHVQYRLIRCRVVANMLGFADLSEKATIRPLLKQELDLLRSEYETMLFGGPVINQVPDSKALTAPSAALASAAHADLFYRTKACLRADVSSCYGPSDHWYAVTHSGLDAMVQRFIDDLLEFTHLPSDLAWPNATSYEYTWRVAAIDLYDGIHTATTLFVTTTMDDIQRVRTMHSILLVMTILLLLGYAVFLVRPYISNLKIEATKVAGLLSLLPAEVNVDGQLRNLMSNFKKQHKKGNKNIDITTGDTALGVTGAVARPGPRSSLDMLAQP